MINYYLAQTEKNIEMPPNELEHRGLSRLRMGGWTFLMSVYEDVDYGIDEVNEVFVKPIKVNISNMVSYHSNNLIYQGWNAIGYYLRPSISEIKMDPYIKLIIFGSAFYEDPQYVLGSLDHTPASPTPPTIALEPKHKIIKYVWNNNIDILENIHEIQKGILSCRKSASGYYTWDNIGRGSFRFGFSTNSPRRRYTAALSPYPPAGEFN